MISNELLQSLRELNRADKLHIVQFLASELLNDEPGARRSATEYPIWSPLDAVEAADAMLSVLRSAEAQDHAER